MSSRRNYLLPHSLRLFSTALALLATSAAHAQFVGVNFTGIDLNTEIANGINLAPPDTNGAVGPTQIAEFINGGYAVYSKSGATVSAYQTDTAFWTNAGISSSTLSAGLSDTKIIYDSASQRWFASELTTSNTGNKILVARSNSSDLTAGWKATSYTANSGFGDYATLSVDTNGVYISTNNFTSSVGSPSGTNTLTSIPKSDLLLSTPSLSNATTFNLSANTYGFTLQGAVDTSAGTGSILAVSNTTFGQLKRFNINGSGAAGATLSAVTTINVGATSNPGLGSQPDGTVQVDNGDDRISAQPVKVGNQIVLAHVIRSGSNNAIRITVLNATTNAVLSENTISAAGLDYSYPSVSVSSSGKVVVGFSRSGSGAGQYIGSYARVGDISAAGVITFGAADIIVKAGQTNYHQFGSTERWGDYSATVVDPTDPNTFWTFQEVAGPTANRWSTQISQIRAVPAPSSVAVFAGVALPGLMALRRKRRNTN